MDVTGTATAVVQASGEPMETGSRVVSQQSHRFMGLPLEIITHIARFLPQRDILTFSLLDKTCFALVRDARLQERAFARRNGGTRLPRCFQVDSYGHAMKPWFQRMDPEATAEMDGAMNTSHFPFLVNYGVARALANTQHLQLRSVLSTPHSGRLRTPFLCLSPDGQHLAVYRANPAPTPSEVVLLAIGGTRKPSEVGCLTHHVTLGGCRFSEDGKTFATLALDDDMHCLHQQDTGRWGGQERLVTGKFNHGQPCHVESNHILTMAAVENRGMGTGIFCWQRDNNLVWQSTMLPMDKQQRVTPQISADSQMLLSYRNESGNEPFHPNTTAVLWQKQASGSYRMSDTHSLQDNLQAATFVGNKALLLQTRSEIFLLRIGEQGELIERARLPVPMRASGTRRCRITFNAVKCGFFVHDDDQHTVRYVGISEQGDVQEGQALASLPVMALYNTRCIVSSDGKHLVIENGQQVQVISENEQKQWQQSLGPFPSPSRNIVFSPDQQHMVLRHWAHRPHTGNRLLPPPQGQMDQSHLYKEAQVYTFQRTRCQWLVSGILKGAGSLFHVAFSPNAEMLATACGDRYARIYGKDQNRQWFEKARMVFRYPVINTTFTLDNIHLVATTIDDRLHYIAISKARTMPPFTMETRQQAAKRKLGDNAQSGRGSRQKRRSVSHEV
ncbi:hypothetical protein [Parendozoicomonas haliclonae]|uniref:F-box domain-containing protein n=1 Tax=Parendozoicomonas haliclonae TaxID=1960125 RepID=A0A1X7AMY0_9GAMM|nr:hypothetical protein [Parendozoicomonas haliclonae]SMA49391.1 hypothetical protein EHSB41UT_03228 [Parendozoicomonas haliclonae]